MKVVAALVLLLSTVQWRPEERVLISEFSYVDAVAASPWLVFAATRHGLLVYDRMTRAWRPPVTTLDGYPTTRVRSAIADLSGNAVWLGTAEGYVRYDVDARFWTRGTPPPPDAQVMTVEGALARAPAADALRALILTDPRLRSYQFTAVAGTPDRPELFFGTNGMGLVRVNPQTGEWDALPYGLVAPGVGAIAPGGGAGGVWTATSARPGGIERRGFTWVAADLSATRPAEGGRAALGFNFLQARRLLATAGALWLATEQGVERIDPGTMRSRRFDVPDATSLAPAPDGIWVGSTRGLQVITRDGNIQRVSTDFPDATSLAPAPDGIWVGSTRGLQVITRDGNIVRVSTDFPVLSLAAARDTLWIGTNAGLVMMPPDAANTVAVAAVTQPIYAVTGARDTVVAATERSLVWRDAAGAWKELPLSLALGRPTALAADWDGGVWIGGTQGLAYADLRRAHVRTLTVPLDLPAAVRDILADEDYLWVATDSGLVRFDRRAARNR